MSMDHHFLTPRFLNTYCNTKPQVDLPGGPVVKNSPANAGYMGSIHTPEDPTCHVTNKSMYRNSMSPCSSDHKLQLLSLHATTTEARML